MPQEWKESISVGIHKKGNKVDCNEYREMPIFTTAYKIFPNTLLAKMTPICKLNYRRISIWA